MKYLPLIICAIVALALPACTTTKKEECSTSGSCCAKGGVKSSKHKH